MPLAEEVKIGNRLCIIFKQAKDDRGESVAVRGLGEGYKKQLKRFAGHPTSLKMSIMGFATSLTIYLTPHSVRDVAKRLSDISNDVQYTPHR